MVQNTQEGFPMSCQQRAILSRCDSVGNVPFVCTVLEFRGSVSQEALHQVIREIVLEHEILHTVFVQDSVSDEPLQQIDQMLSGFLWSELKQAPESINELPTVEERILFDARCFKVEECKVIVYLRVSSLLADNHSLTLIAKKIEEKLFASADDEEPVQYIDFAQWQDEIVDEDDDGREFWQAYLVSRCPVNSLPKRNRTTHRERMRQFLSLEGIRLGDGVKEKLLAIWIAVIHRFTGDERLVCMVDTEGRVEQDFNDAIGPYDRSLPLLVDVSPDMTIAKLEQQIKLSYWELNTHQMSFPSRNIHYCLESIRFVFDEHIKSSPRPDTNMHVCDNRQLNEMQSLVLRCHQAVGRLDLEIDFDSSSFDIALIDSLMHAIQSVLIAYKEESPLIRLPLVSDINRAAYLEGPIQVNGCETVISRFEQQAAQFPDAIALEIGGESWTYGGLNRKANRVANGLQAFGIGKGSIVGLCFDRDAVFMISLVAVLKVGAAFAPIDPETPSKRLSQLITSVDILLAGQRDRSIEVAQAEGVKSVVNSLKNSEFNDCADNFVTRVNISDRAYVMFTSGSTGTPKGVEISHGALDNYMRHCIETYWHDAHGAIVHTSIAFDLTITCLLSPLCIGKPVILVPHHHGLEGLKLLLQEKRPPLLLKLTPAHLKALRPWVSKMEANSICVATLVVGGEALYQSDLAPYAKALPSARIFNEYGPTEATVGCSAYECNFGEIAGNNVPIGKPIRGAQLYVFDDAGNMLPPYCVGKLYIGGQGLAVGYLGDTSRTEERFSEATLLGGTSQRLYASGDQVYFIPDEHQGFVYVGRDDAQVKIRGYRVELGDVEATLKANLDVLDVVVTAVKNAFGESELCAYIQTHEVISVEELASGLAEVLPEYMLPGNVVCMERFPLTANGKIDKAALPDPGITKAAGLVAYVAPRNKNESIIAQSFATALRVDQVGINDSFFALGGDSIRAVHVTSLTNEQGLSLRVEDVFQHVTPAGLAKLADAQLVIQQEQQDVLLAALLDEVNELSDADVEARLKELKQEHEA